MKIIYYNLFSFAIINIKAFLNSVLIFHNLLARYAFGLEKRKQKELFFLPIIVFFVHSFSFAQNTSATSTTFSVIPQKLSNQLEVGNPQKGFYQFEKDSFINSLPLFDIYKRFSWRELETSKGVYNFSPIEAQLQLLSPGQKFSFRIMALNTCCTSYKNGADVPNYILDEGLGWSVPFQSINGSDSIFVPDWNDTILISYMENLIDTLALLYDGNPRIGWIENGLYGNWGEWHTYPIQYPNIQGLYNVPPPSASYLYAPFILDSLNINQPKFRDGSDYAKQKILKAYLQAFKKTQLVQSTGDLSILFSALSYSASKPIGIRRDSWGSNYFNNITMYANYNPTAEEWLLFNNRWKIAPFYTENWGAAFTNQQDMLTQIENFHTSAIAFGNIGNWNSLADTIKNTYLKCAIRTGYRYQITKVILAIQNNTLTLSLNFKNNGIAPTYNDWLIKAYIINPKTQILYSNVIDIPINLKNIVDSSIIETCVVNSLQLLPNYDLQTNLQLRLIAKDSLDYCVPLNFDLVNKNSDGSYTLIELADSLAPVKNNFNDHKSVNHFPNPTRDLVTILSSQEHFGKTYLLFDTFGKIVFYGKINGYLTSLDISEFSNGVYFFKIEDNGPATIKIIKN